MNYLPYHCDGPGRDAVAVFVRAAQSHIVHAPDHGNMHAPPPNKHPSSDPWWDPLCMVGTRNVLYTPHPLPPALRVYTIEPLQPFLHATPPFALLTTKAERLRRQARCSKDHEPDASEGTSGPCHAHSHRTLRSALAVRRFANPSLEEMDYAARPGSSPLPRSLHLRQADVADRTRTCKPSG